MIPIIASTLCIFLTHVQIKLWDVRVTKPVQEYKGHYNEHAYLPIHVNEPEGLLLAGKTEPNMLHQQSDDCVLLLISKRCQVYIRSALTYLE